MKTLLKYLVMAFLAIPTININNTASAATLEVYGNQPAVPTATARANRTTWSAVYGSSQGYNEIRGKGYGRLENFDSSMPILYDRANDWAWKPGCYNRVTPVEAPAPTAQPVRTVEVPVYIDRPQPVVQQVPVYIEREQPRVQRTSIFQQIFRPRSCPPPPQRQVSCPPPQRRQQYCPPPMMRRPQPCPPGYAQQRGGSNRSSYRVHNNYVTRNLNVLNAPRGYRPPNSGGSYGNSQGSSWRPSNNVGYAGGNPGFKYYRK